MKKYGIIGLWFATILMGLIEPARADFEWRILRKDGGVVMASKLNFGNDFGWITGKIDMVETTLKLTNVQSMVFEKSQDNLISGEIQMIAGIKARLALAYRGIWFDSEFGRGTLPLSDIRSIERSDGALSAAGPAGGMTISGADQVTMKNGDVLAGTIETGAFGLRTSYGDLAIDSKDIASILMEGGGQNIEMVHLRTGEKISGVLTNEVFLLRRGAGGEMTLQKDKIKSMAFKADR